MTTGDFPLMGFKEGILPYFSYGFNVFFNGSILNNDRSSYWTFHRSMTNLNNTIYTTECRYLPSLDLLGDLWGISRGWLDGWRLLFTLSFISNY